MVCLKGLWLSSIKMDEEKILNKHGTKINMATETQSPLLSALFKVGQQRWPQISGMVLGSHMFEEEK